ncbi:uncharacterized protein CMC5_048240 [Chondromyces crocatus]|uniref:Uncharacterized protein n=1 Tax=Chondromyces crocatus TaxID=52 RepID=A0A0K1EJB2_CHOCO|nr:uncharacterized protein CMC5_048240 [Chondromyces crocatus]
MALLALAFALGTFTLLPDAHPAGPEEAARASVIVASRSTPGHANLAIQDPLLTPKREVPQSTPSSSSKEAWDTAAVVCITVLVALALGAFGTAGIRGNRHYFKRDPRETQRLRESDQEARNRDSHHGGAPSH